MTTPELDATFAFVDLAGFTAVTEAHGDREAVAIVHAFRSRVLDTLGPDDELVKTIGDAVMLRFPTPADAVVALQELVEREACSADAVLLPRIGAHHGPAVAIEGDYYGAAVNLASRVAGLAKPGQLLVTSEVAWAAQERGAVITHVGTPALRNVSNRVDIWDVRVGTASVDTTIDPVCQMRVSTDDDNAITLDWQGRRHHFCGLPCVARFADAPATYLRDLRRPSR
jgi:class 3 adenylate cyclase/YHS domain-containing protein